MREKLKQLKKIKDRIEIINNEIEFIENEYIGIGSPDPSKEMNGASHNANKCPLLDKIDKYGTKLDDYKKLLESLKLEYIDEREKLVMLIENDKLTGNEHDVMYYRYVCFMSYEQIIQKMFISESTIKRAINKAIEKISDNSH